MAFTLYSPTGQAKAFPSRTPEAQKLLAAGWTLTPQKAAAPQQFDYGAIAKQFAEAVAPQQAPRPSFDQSGLYNEGDAKAQAEAEFNPYFNEQEQNRQRDVQREMAQRLRQQQSQTGTLEGDYLNRGLSRSGAFVGAQQDLAQQQALAQAMGQESATERQKALALKKAGALEDYRTKAYDRAYQRYLAQFQ